MFKIEFKEIRDNEIVFIVILPVNLLHTFTELFYLLKQVFEYSERKLKISNIYESVGDSVREVKRKQEKQKDDFEIKVLQIFDNYISDGCDVLESIRLTKKQVETHPWGAYQAVLEIVRKNGRLKKNGVYTNV